MSTVTQSEHHKKMLEKLTALEQSLVDADPKMPNHLREIHTLLISYEELAHLLSEEQIATIIKAQSQRVGVILAEETKKAASKGKNARVSADDL